MGVVLIISIALIVSIVITKICYRCELLNEFIGPILIIVCTVTLICLISGIILNYAYIDAETASYNEQYKSLMYQIENGMYNNVNEVGKKQLMDQVTKWNSDLVALKLQHNSFWINWFYPIDYDQFEFIPIEMIE